MKNLVLFLFVFTCAPVYAAMTYWGDLKIKGTTVVENEKPIRFSEAVANGTNYVALKAPSSLSSNYTFTLPGDYGTNGYVLQTNGSGVTSWVAQSGGAVSGLYCKINWGYAANANWGSVTGGAYAIPLADTDYPTPTVTTTTLGSGAGVTCAAAGTKVPTLVTTSLPAGEYHIVSVFGGWGDSNTRCFARLTDGTTNGNGVMFGSNSSVYVLPAINVMLDVVYGTTTNADFSIQLSSTLSSAGTCMVYNGAATGTETTIYLYRVR